MNGPEDAGKDFWSRRKAAVQAAEDAEQADKAAQATAEEHARLADMPDEEILDKLGLPDPDTLTDEDDFSKFLGAAVPERLRRRALRRLWALNPVLANLDGLVDYAEDYTDAATVIEGMQTVYQVGKGMFDKFAALADDDEPADLPAADDDEPADLPAAEDTETVAREPDTESSVELQCEEDDASHNDFIQKGKTSFQLTQGDSLVQSVEEKAGSLDLYDSALDDHVEEPRLTRYRMRFDYL